MRGIWTIVRIAFYAAIIALLVVGQKSKNPMISGLVCGAILADLITWIGISIVEIPRFLRQITIDGVVNIVSLLVIFRFVGVEVPHDEERMVVAFLAFILVSVTKGLLYLLERFFGSEDWPTGDL
ncbi:MAG: hypothetical protein V1873_00725 [Verrucomicrobiota bacterium]